MFFNAGIRKIQLWSDVRGEEFAVRLSNEQDFRAVSNPAANYTKLVDEGEHFDDMSYDWKYLLEHWSGVKNGSIKLFDENNEKERPITTDLEDVAGNAFVNQGKKGRNKSGKPLLKCRYCMLSYNSEKEKSAHELAWHSAKMKNGSGLPDIC